ISASPCRRADHSPVPGLPQVCPRRGGRSPRSGAGSGFELPILGFLGSAISFLNSENSPLEGQVIVQSAATSSEVRFAPAALDEYRARLGRYPTRQAALLPTLWIAQREFGWISPAVEEYVAALMELPPAHVHAVVSFYSMFHRAPVGRWHLEVCANLS